MKTLRPMRRVLRRWADGLCAALWAMALVVLIVGAGAGAVRQARRQDPVPSLRRVVVPRGGTLWGLAMRCRLPGQDPRAVAAEIRSLNRLGRARTLHPGTQLVVPDYRSGADRLARNPHERG